MRWRAIKGARMEQRWDESWAMGEGRWAFVEGGALLVVGALMAFGTSAGEWGELLLMLGVFWGICGVSAVVEVTRQPHLWSQQGLKVVLSLSSAAVVVTAAVSQVDLMAAAIFGGIQAMVVGGLEAGQALFGQSWRRIALGAINGAVGLLVLMGLAAGLGWVSLAMATVLMSGGLALMSAGFR